MKILSEPYSGHEEAVAAEQGFKDIEAKIGELGRRVFPRGFDRRSNALLDAPRRLLFWEIAQTGN